MDPSRRSSRPRVRFVTSERDPIAILFERIARFVGQLPAADAYFRRRFELMADLRHGRGARALMRYEIARSGIPIAGSQVLDAGAGPGTYAVALVAHGARHVIAIDQFPQHVAALAAVARRFRLPIEAQVADASRLTSEGAQFHLVYCREAISHFADWEAFVGECVRVLRPGGAVVVSDGNNGANPLVRQRIRKAWMVSERGPFEPRHFPPGAELPYLFRRWMLIRRELPEIGDEQLFQLGLATSTLGGDALRSTLQAYRRTGRLRAIAYRAGISVRRPEDGQRNEEPIDPLGLATRWRALGLDARVHPHFGFRRGRLVRALNALAARVPAIGARLSPAYVVTARRPLELAPSPVRV